MAQMRSAGISTSTQRHGCRTVSMEKQLWKDSVNSCGYLWNTYVPLLVPCKNIDEFDATKYKLEYDKLSVMDKWLLQTELYRKSR